MLRIRSNFFNLGLAAVVLFMSSCSIMNNEFSKRKYTRFNNHHESETANASVKNVPVTSSVHEQEMMNVNTERRSVAMNAPAPDQKNNAQNKKFSSSFKKEGSELGRNNVSFTKTFIKTYSTLHKMAKHSNRPNTNEVLLILLCIFLPFIAVLVERGVCTEFWITCLLCLFFWLPGVIYAFIVCFGGGGSGRSATR